MRVSLPWHRTVKTLKTRVPNVCCGQADPAVQQQLTYNVAIEGAVLAAVSGMLGSFVDTVYAMEKEAAQQSSDRPASTSGHS